LARDLDIVLLDATRPWGFDYLLPRGLLREAPGGLTRAGVILLTRCDQVARETLVRLQNDVGKLVPHAMVVLTSHHATEWINTEGKTQALEKLVGRRVLAFCGIGNPEAFRQTLGSLGIKVEVFRSFADHQAYSPEDV